MYRRRHLRDKDGSDSIETSSAANLAYLPPTASLYHDQAIKTSHLGREPVTASKSSGSSSITLSYRPCAVCL